MTELSRRALLSGICGIAALSMVPISAEASTLVKKLPKGRLSFKVSDAAKIWDTAVESKSNAFVSAAKADVRDDGSIIVHSFIYFYFLCVGFP